MTGQRLLNAFNALYSVRPHLSRGGMTDALAGECQTNVNPEPVRRLMKVGL